MKTITQRLADLKEGRRYTSPFAPYAGGYVTHSEDGRSIYLDEKQLAALRHVGQAGQMSPSIRDSNDGWYTDNMPTGETYQGHVYQLPAHRGQERFLAAVMHSDWSGATLDPSVYPDKESAARVADSMAEHMAECAREDDAKFQAEQQIEAAKERIALVRVKVQGLHTDIVSGPFGPNVCEAIRDCIRDYRREVHKLTCRIGELRSNPWASVE